MSYLLCIITKRVCIIDFPMGFRPRLCTCKVYTDVYSNSMTRFVLQVSSSHELVVFLCQTCRYATQIQILLSQEFRAKRDVFLPAVMSTILSTNVADQVTHELSSEATPLSTSNPSPANGDIGSCEGPENAL